MKSLLASLHSEQQIDARLERIIEGVIGRLQDGEVVDAERLVAEHSEYAEQIRELLPAIEMMVRLGDATGGPAAAGAANGRSTQLPYKELGDFRLVRELGRGGMGTVFEAEQLSMGRRVALKVLPFAALVQDKSLQRFRNEVRAAAALDHPNIVSIYSVGEDRGVHFYAMQLIRGQTLAEMIHELRTKSVVRGPLSVAKTSDLPTTDHGRLTTDTQPVAALSTIPAFDSREHYRTAARIGIQAAEALQHAHDQGVLHRDIKPGNLMLDGEGKLYVTDFGLARIEADAGLTMTGDIIGTLRYMAPEQALAKRVVIDHRADIYSLGATLYELLTLKPALGETDRAELLKQIAFDEPRPLRKIDRSIPAELETIVLKAMAKQPEERYQTAQRLADDLRAYVEHRPIKAKPPTLVNRAAKWSRRHGQLVALATLSAAILLVMGVAMLTFSNAQIRSESAAKATALAEKDAALAKAREAVDQMLTRIADEKLLNVPLADPLRKALYEDALRFYEGFLQQAQADPIIRLETAKAIGKIGNIYREMGRYDEARQAQQRGIDMLHLLVASNPSEPTYREALADSYGRLAFTIYSGPSPDADHTEAEAYYREALRLCRELERDFPDRPQLSCVLGLGQLSQGRGDRVEAEQLYRQAIAECESYLRRADHPIVGADIQLTWARFNLAAIWRSAGPESKPEEAEMLFLEVIKGAEIGLESDPKSTARRCQHAAANWLLGALYRDTNRVQQGIPCMRQALEEYQSLAQEHPWETAYWKSTREVTKSLISTLESSGHDDDAKEALCQASEWIEEITPSIPKNPGPQAELAECRILIHSRLADVAAEEGAWEKVVEEFGQLAAQSRGDVETLYHFAVAQLQLNDQEGYRRTCDQIVQLTDAATDSLALDWRFVWTCVIGPDALDDYHLPLQHARELVAANPQNASYLTMLAALSYRTERYDEAAKQLTAAIAAFADDTSDQFTIIYPQLFQAMNHWRLGHKSESHRLLAESQVAIDEAFKLELPSNRRATLNLLRREAESLISPANELAESGDQR